MDTQANQLNDKLCEMTMTLDNEPKVTATNVETWEQAATAIQTIHKETEKKDKQIMVERVGDFKRYMSPDLAA